MGALQYKAASGRAVLMCFATVRQEGLVLDAISEIQRESPNGTTADVTSGLCEDWQSVGHAGRREDHPL